MRRKHVCQARDCPNHRPQAVGYCEDCLESIGQKRFWDRKHKVWWSFDDYAGLIQALKKESQEKAYCNIPEHLIYGMRFASKFWTDFLAVSRAPEVRKQFKVVPRSAAHGMK